MFWDGWWGGVLMGFGDVGYGRVGGFMTLVEKSIEL